MKIHDDLVTDRGAGGGAAPVCADAAAVDADSGAELRAGHGRTAGAWRDDAAQDADARFSSLVESAHSAIIVADSEGYVLSWNGAASRIFGYSREEMLGSPLSLIMPKHCRESGENGAAWIRLAIRNIASETTLEMTGLRRNGREFPMELSLGTWMTDGEAFVSCIISDITARCRVEAEHAKLATAVEQAAEAIIITGCDETISYINPAFEKISGYARAELVGKKTAVLKSGAHDDRFYSTLWGTLLMGNVWTGAITNRRKDGAHFDVEAVITPVRDAKGSITSFVYTYRDITYERQMQEQVRHAQKMEAVGRLAGGVAHDFNNLLTVITGFAHMIENARPAADSIHQNAEEILKASDRAIELTRQLLAFSRKQLMRPSALGLNALIRNVETMLRQLVGEAIEVRLHLAEELGVVSADPGQLEQVLVNMVINARDAMPGGGTLTITTANAGVDHGMALALDCRIPVGDYITLSIADTGTGMSPEVSAHIFEPFFTTKEQGRGTGLGLATCHGIIEQSGGDVRVYSERGLGTVMKIYLPRSGEKADAHAHPPRKQKLPGGSETVLVVEDEPAVAGLIAMILRNAGYQVLKASNGIEGLRLFKDNTGTPIALVVTDVVMPEMGGVAMAAALREIHSDLRVLFLSGYTRDALQHHGVLDPDVAFLEKPFTAMCLTTKVREVLDHTTATVSAIAA